MFAQAVKDHQSRVQVIRASNGMYLVKEILICVEVKRKAVARSLSQCSEAMLEKVNEGVSAVFANEKKIEQVSSVSTSLDSSRRTGGKTVANSCERI